ncbi:Nucleosome-remodeling factor subunit BPTF [Larimichthys crocea]|uniref:Uncharacterized protein n=1 Tax=Larimichthys crocea TaxID=215358 RepID=A0ACD3R8G1_LARCR|nr:Nucleosome-remodeling factor subunit BPTF [Larimichthys crocea]
MAQLMQLTQGAQGGNPGLTVVIQGQGQTQGQLQIIPQGVTVFPGPGQQLMQAGHAKRPGPAFPLHSHASIFIGVNFSTHYCCPYKARRSSDPRSPRVQPKSRRLPQPWPKPRWLPLYPPRHTVTAPAPVQMPRLAPTPASGSHANPSFSCYSIISPRTSSNIHSCAGPAACRGPGLRTGFNLHTSFCPHATETRARPGTKYCPSNDCKTKSPPLPQAHSRHKPKLLQLSPSSRLTPSALPRP